jgi:predicted transcriptional regulator YheO
MSEETLKKLAKFSLSFTEFMQRAEQEPKPDRTVKNDNNETVVKATYTNDELAENDRKAREVFDGVQNENLIKTLAQKCNSFSEFHSYMKRLRGEE